MGQSDTTFRHHLDQVTGTELESEVPSHTQNDDLLVKVPPLEQILCRGRFRHLGRYGCAPVFSSLHQNRIERVAPHRIDVSVTPVATKHRERRRAKHIDHSAAPVAFVA
jgi:hypothetical protein